MCNPHLTGNFPFLLFMMDLEVVKALRVLGFEDLSVIPKVKEITRRYRKLAFLNHPDRHPDDPAATAKFQEILNAYHVAGKAAEDIPDDTADNDELVARKMFKQFQMKSVKENSTSITILTEKCLYSSWMDTLTRFAGLPENKGPNGNKFTVTDSLNGSSVKIFLTMYRTGKLLIQAEKNQHSINLHFINTHLEKLFNEVYSQKSIQTQPNRPKTPVTKPVKTAGRIILKFPSH